MINLLALCTDLRIPYRTSGNHHCRSGWVQLDCPFCDEKNKWHLGYNLSEGYFVCWRCGGHSEWHTLKRLLNLPSSSVTDILARYHTAARRRGEERRKIDRVREAPLPPGTEPLQQAHIDYLLGRRYDPQELQFHWQLCGTTISTHAWKFRVIAPVMFRGIRVACTGRAIHKRNPLRWNTTPDDDWAISKRHVLYGLDSVQGDTVYIVEGPSDAWRLGPGAVGTMGTAFSSAQVNLLRKFPRRIILFDADARKHARRLCSLLSCFHGDTIDYPISQGDVGDWRASDVRAFRRQFLPLHPTR